MALERTFAIIKPDAYKRGLTGEVLSRIHKAGFSILAIKSVSLSKTEAEGFYAVHKARPFFGELTDLHELRQMRPDCSGSRWSDSKVARNNGRNRSCKS